MSNTETAQYKLTVKESGAGEPWLMFEPMTSSLQILGNGFLGFRLKPGTTYEKAQEIASYINSSTQSVSYTKL